MVASSNSPLQLTTAAHRDCTGVPANDRQCLIRLGFAAAVEPRPLSAVLKWVRGTPSGGSVGKVPASHVCPFKNNRSTLGAVRVCGRQWCWSGRQYRE
jgi:hypothetical protein